VTDFLPASSGRKRQDAAWIAHNTDVILLPSNRMLCPGFYDSAFAGAEN